MKRTFLSLFMGLMVLAVFSQPSFLRITGQITDDSTGAPIPFHIVRIMGDSTGGTCPNGMLYSQIAKTNMNGIYFKQIPIWANSPGNFIVSTKDCNQTVHSQIVPAVVGIDTVNFSICNGATPPPPLPCHAAFVAKQHPKMPGKVKFVSQSVPLAAIHSWDFGDGNTSNLKHPMHTYAAPGTYNVCLVISDNLGYCADTFCMNVLVDTSNIPVPLPCHAAFDVKQFAHMFGKVKFVSKSTPYNIQHQWDFGDGNTSNLKHPVHVYSNPGTYNVCLVISDTMGLCVDTFCANVVIDTLLPPPPVVCQANFAYVIDSLTAAVHFHDMSLPVFHQSHWDFGDGTYSNIKNPVHVYASPGSYTVTLIIACPHPNNPCADTVSQIVVIPAVKSGTNVSATKDLSAWNIGQVYPNPSTGEAKIDVEIQQAGKLILQVIDLMGRSVYESTGNYEKGSYSLVIPANLASGYYAVYLRHENGEAAIRKMNRIEK